MQKSSRNLYFQLKQKSQTWEGSFRENFFKKSKTVKQIKSLTSPKIIAYCVKKLEVIANAGELPTTITSIEPTISNLRREVSRTRLQN